MTTLSKNRLDPSALGPGQLDQLLEFLDSPTSPALINEKGERTEIPGPLFEALSRILHQMKEGTAIVMLPEDETLTIQAAANFLGVSRQHLVRVLENGDIPFHKAGSHRRVIFKDLLVYDEARNKKRAEALRKLSKKVSDEDLYDADYPTVTR